MWMIVFHWISGHWHVSDTRKEKILGFSWIMYIDYDKVHSLWLFRHKVSLKEFSTASFIRRNTGYSRREVTSTATFDKYSSDGIFASNRQLQAQEATPRLSVAMSHLKYPCLRPWTPIWPRSVTMNNPVCQVIMYNQNSESTDGGVGKWESSVPMLWVKATATTRNTR